MSRLTSLLAALLFAAALPPAAAADRGAELEKLYTEFWEEDLKLSPLSGKIGRAHV